MCPVQNPSPGAEPFIVEVLSHDGVPPVFEPISPGRRIGLSPGRMPVGGASGSVCVGRSHGRSSGMAPRGDPGPNLAFKLSLPPCTAVGDLCCCASLARTCAISSSASSPPKLRDTSLSCVALKRGSLASSPSLCPGTAMSGAAMLGSRGGGS